MIIVQGLSYQVGDQKILRRVNLRVEKGCTVAVMGMSGVGKSTLLKCIAGLVEPVSGQVLIDGANIVGIEERDRSKIRRRMGMVFQYGALFDSLSVYENVSFGLRRHTNWSEQEIAAVVNETLSMVGLPRTGDLMPSELSGGMQKRVGLARAIAMEPDVVLYDEPTAGLDPITSATIAELIVKTRDQLGVTSVVVSHDIPTIKRVSNSIAMLHAGRIVASGSVEEMENCEDKAVRQFMDGSIDGPIEITR